MRFSHIMGLFILLVITQNQCMDQKDKKFTLQKQETLYLSDGNYEIDRWKIFTSNTLHETYLGGGFKNRLPFDLNEIDLYSKACDCKPGTEFKEYFSSLSPEDRRILTVAAGKYSPNLQQKKLHSPSLISELCNVCLDANIYTNIKSHMEQYWLSYCQNTVVKDNLPRWFPDFLYDPLCYEATDNGRIQIVPACLLSGSYNGPMGTIFTINDDKEFITYRIKPIDDTYAYRLTAIDSEDKDKDTNNNQRLLRFVNCNTNSGTSILIKHEDQILFSQFSFSGEHLCTVSDKMVLLSKIMKKEDNSLAITNLSVPTPARCLSALFNKKSTALILCCWDEGNNQGGLSLWDITNNDCVKKFERNESFTTGICNEETDRLLTKSREDGVCTMTVWNTANLSHIYQIGKLKATANDFFVEIACAPYGKKWVTVTNTGTVIFVTEIDAQIVYVEEQLDDFGTTDEELAQIKILYSPDGFYVAILYPHNKKCFMVSLYNALTYEKLGAWPTAAKGIGFTSDSHQLILNLGDPNNRFWGKIPLLNPGDCKNLKDLAFASSIHQLAVLHRLAKACQNKDTVELYEEEQAYKALQTLSRTSRDIIKKSLPVPTIINNNKELVEIGKNVLKKVEDQYDDTVKKIQDWWKKF